MARSDIIRPFSFRLGVKNVGALYTFAKVGISLANIMFLSDFLSD
jgi:hypothetical protein